MAKVKLLTLADAFLAMVPKLTFKTTTLSAGSAVTIGTVTSGTDYEVTLGLPSGPRGLTGLTPNFTIGNVVASSSGGTASAALRGTVDNPILDLTIPRGLTGATPNFTISATTTSAAGTSASVTLGGTAESPTLAFTVPRGNTGLTPSITMGTVTTGASGGSVVASFRGTTDNPILDLTIPRGTVGLTPTFTIGNVTTGASGATAAVALRGTAENPILDLTIPRGLTGLTPNLTIGNVTTLSPGSNATASFRGTVDNPILDLALPRGTAGAGTGDVVAANNGSEYTATKDSFHANLGAGTGTGGGRAVYYATDAGAVRTAIGAVAASAIGTAAMYNVGVTNGNIAVLESGGVFNAARIPVVMGHALDVLTPDGSSTAPGLKVRAASASSAVNANMSIIEFTSYAAITYGYLISAGTSQLSWTGQFYLPNATAALTTAFRAGISTTVMSVVSYWNALDTVALTDNANINPDFSTGVNFTLTMTAGVGSSRLINSPTNTKPGQRGFIKITQPNETGANYTVSWGSAWKYLDFNTLAPQLNVGGGSVTTIEYLVTATGDIQLFPGKLFATIADIQNGTVPGVAMTSARYWGALQAATLNDASSINLDLSTAINFTLTMTTGVGATRALTLSNSKVGQRGFIRFVSPSGIAAGTTYVSTFSSGFRFDGGTAPLFNAGPNAITVLDYEVTAVGELTVTGGKTSTLATGTAADFLGGTATTAISPLSYWNAQATTALTDAATTTIDFATGINFTLLTTTAIGTTRTLSVSNAKVGQRGFIRVVQSAALPAGTVHNVVFNGSFRYGDNTTSPLINPGSNAVTVFDYEITATGEVSITGGRTFATSSEFLTGTSTAALNIATFWSGQAPVSLVDASTVTLDLSKGINFALDMTTATGTTRTVNFSNLRVGQRGFIRVSQPVDFGLNNFTVNWGSNYYTNSGADPVLNTGYTAVTIIHYDVTSSTRILLSAGKPTTEATAAEYRSATAGRVLAPDKVWAANQVVTLSTSDITNGLNFNNFINATYSITTFTTLDFANPTGGMKPGQSGVITFVNNIFSDGQVSPPLNTPTFGTQWFSANGVAPTFSAIGGGITRLFYTITSTGTVDIFTAQNPGRIYDADAKAYFDAMTVQPSTTRKGLINDFIKGLKADGVWAKLDNLWLLASHDEQSSRINAVRPSKLLSKYGSPYFVTDRGWQQTSSDGASSSNHLYSPDAYFGASLKRNNVNDLSFGIWQNTAFNETQNGYLCGESTSNFYDYLYYSSSTLYGKVANSQVATLGYPQQKGLRAVTHIDGNANQFVFASGVGFGSVSYNGGGNSSSTFSMLNAGGFGSYSGTNNRLSFGFTGAGLTQAQINSLNARLNTYLNAIGAN